MDEPPLEGCDVSEGWLVEAVSGAEVEAEFIYLLIPG